EPNDALARAQAVNLPAAIAGHIDRSKDVDWYKLTVPPPNKQTLRAELLPRALDLYLDVLDMTGERIVAVNDGKAGEAETISAVTLSPGTYFVRVRESVTKPAAGQPAAGLDNSYSLILRLAPPDPNMEEEPND